MFQAVVGNMELLTWQDYLHYRDHREFFNGDNISLCESSWMTMHRADEKQMVYLYEKQRALEKSGTWSRDFERPVVEEKVNFGVERVENVVL